MMFWHGCGPQVIIIDTAGNESASPGSPGAAGLHIASVKDTREQDPKLVGHITGQVGGKKAYIYLQDSLSVFIKNYLNSLPGYPDSALPVNITINSFSLAENFSKKDEYHLFGSLSYRYTDGGGINKEFVSSLSSDFSRDESSLAAGINSALKESFNGFIDKLRTERVQDGVFRENLVPDTAADSTGYGTGSPDELQIRPPSTITHVVKYPERDSTIKRGDSHFKSIVDSTEVSKRNSEIENSEAYDTDSYSPELPYPDSTRSPGIVYDQSSSVQNDSSFADDRNTNRSNIVFDEPVTAPDIKKSAAHIGAGMSYYTGSSITGGMQVEFRMSWQKPDWEYGFSVGFLYVNFITHSYEGSLWALNLPWNMKYMLKDDFVSPYAGLTIKLIAGTTNENGNNQQGYYYSYNGASNNYFWGPTFEESLGISLDRSVFIEGGVYQMFLFGTDYLPSDIGFRISLHFTVTK